MSWLVLLTLTSAALLKDSLVKGQHAAHSSLERIFTFENTPPLLPDLDCSTENLDAAIYTGPNRTYFFKGHYYWRLIDTDVAPGYPRLISQDWDGLPGNLDAAVTTHSGRTFFFKGCFYWSFRGKKMEPGYPQLINEGFGESIPNDLDAATLWSNTGNIYFFKGNHFWRYDGREANEPVNPNYPSSISEWKGLTGPVDAALQWENRLTYFYKGGMYYRYEDKGLQEGRSLDGLWGRSCSALRRMIQQQNICR